MEGNLESQFANHLPVHTVLVLSCPDTEIYWSPVHKAVGYQRRAHHPFHSEDKEKREISLQFGGLQRARDSLRQERERRCCPGGAPHSHYPSEQSQNPRATPNSPCHKPTLLTSTQKIHKTVSHNTSKSSRGARPQSGVCHRKQHKGCGKLLGLWGKLSGGQPRKWALKSEGHWFPQGTSSYTQPGRSVSPHSQRNADLSH